MTTVLHTDIPTLDDKLELEAELKRMRDRVLHCSTPHVLGVHGDWGSGKTSFMRQLQHSLGGEMPTDASVGNNNRPLPRYKKKELQKSVITVWFDAWRFQNEAVPVVALLQEMRRQLSGSNALLEQLKKIGTIATISALDNLASIGKTISFDCLPDVEKIEKRGQQWEKENYSEQISSNSIREHLCTVINQLLPSHDAKVVVFIDDLDRCSAKAAMRLLEGLKIYLTVPSCVFILGMNERILVDAIQEELMTMPGVPHDDLRLRASHYLEKICTDIFRLPLPRSPITLLSQWIEDREHRNALQLAIGSTVCLPPNPRRLKALANQWSRFAACLPFPANHDEQKYWAIRVLITAYIHQFHRDLWERWHFDPDFWEQILTFCDGDFGDAKPEWVKSLKLTFTPANILVARPQLRIFPNPGDVENFWIGSVISKYKVHLRPIDFTNLLVNNRP